VRTPNGNDYGKDLLRQHYQYGHHATSVWYGYEWSRRGHPSLPDM